MDLVEWLTFCDKGNLALTIVQTAGYSFVEKTSYLRLPIVPNFNFPLHKSRLIGYTIPLCYHKI